MKNHDTNTCNSSCDIDTNPDEENTHNNYRKQNSCQIPQEKGPNINLKCFKKRYSSEEEKQFIFENESGVGYKAKMPFVLGGNNERCARIH